MVQFSFNTAQEFSQMLMKKKADRTFISEGGQSCFCSMCEKV